jgi:hypothetical protein
VLAIAIVGSAALAQSPPPPAGHWVGTLQVPGQPIDIEIDLAPGAEGKWQGAINIPAQNVKGMPLANITVAGTAVDFDLKGPPGDPHFKGTYSKDKDTLAGDYTQGGSTIAFSLTRKGDAQFEAVAKSTPIAKELEGSWEGTLDAGGKQLRLVLKLANQPAGATGTLVSVDQGGVELPVDAITQSGSSLSFAVRTVGGSYEGELKDGQIAGTWMQGPGKLPLVFKPAAK